MSGRRSQAKGRRAELELAQYLQEHGCADAKAGEPLNFGTVPDVTGIDGLHIECKRHERLEISNWYNQAQADAQRMKDGRPAVIFRQNRKPWMIVISLSDFLEIIKNDKV